MNRKITRRSDIFKVADPTSFHGIVWCPNCKGRLQPMKDNQFNLKCWECGEEVPIKSIKYDTTLTQVDKYKTSLVTNKNASRRRIKGRPMNPIQQELVNKGLQVIDSTWEDRRL